MDPSVKQLIEKAEEQEFFVKPLLILYAQEISTMTKMGENKDVYRMPLIDPDLITTLIDRVVDPYQQSLNHDIELGYFWRDTKIGSYGLTESHVLDNIVDFPSIYDIYDYVQLTSERDFLCLAYVQVTVYRRTKAFFLPETVYGPPSPIEIKEEEPGLVECDCRKSN